MGNIVSIPYKFLFISIVFGVLVFLHPLPVRGTVDTKNSNYFDSTVDILFPGSGFDLKIERTYNSRSVNNGIFGYGWCSSPESLITKSPEGQLRYQECGAGEQIVYSPSKSTDKSVEKALDQVVQQIISYVKKSNPSATSDYLDLLRSRLKSEPDVRERWAKRANINAPRFDGERTFVANTLGVEQIKWTGDSYQRTRTDGVVQQFNADGRLIKITDRNGNFLRFNWSGDVLKEISDSSNRRLVLTPDLPNRRVKKIQGPGNIFVEYTYNGEDLVGVKDSRGQQMNYAYDSQHNLTRITYPDGKFKALTYDKDRDLVMSFADRADGGVSCMENYTWEMSKDPKEDPRNHFWSTILKKCNDKVVNESRFEFWYRVKPDQSKYLHRVATSIKRTLVSFSRSPGGSKDDSSNSADNSEPTTITENLDVIYHPDFGRPISLRKNGVSTTFAYYPNGLVREKVIDNKLRFYYEYKGKNSKLSKMKSERWDDKDKRKVVQQVETKYEWDSAGNLSVAKNSSGQYVRLKWENGHIYSIQDQAKKEVVLTWDKATNRVKQLTRPGLGSVMVSYAANEDIQADYKDGGPMVGKQIYNTFNNFLELVGPATAELEM